jgi:hypothetical protein
MLLYLKFNWESNNKKVEDSTIFPMAIYLPSSDQWFRFYDYLHDNRFAKNCNSGRTAAMREKLNLGLFGWDSSCELNTKKVGQLSQLSIGYLYNLIGPTV